jgi:uncharacterized protein (DUF302 family)
VPSLPYNGMVHLSRPYSVAETITRLEALLKAKGLTEFCRIDHSGEAEKVTWSPPWGKKSRTSEREEKPAASEV